MDDEIDAGKDWFLTFYNQEKADIVQNLPAIGEKVIAPALNQALTSLKMSGLGKMSGISRQMKGLEQDLITDGMTAAGVPMAGTIAKYMKKYPILRELAPMFMGKRQTANNPGSGRQVPNMG